MATVSRARTVAAAPDEVWKVLADFGAISAWARNVDHSCLLEHPAAGVAVGTARRVQVGRNALVERIVEITPPTALEYRIEGLPPRLGRLTNRWTLAPDGPGRTRVTLTSAARAAPGPLAGLAENTICRMVCRMMSRQSDAMLAGLAARVEGSP